MMKMMTHLFKIYSELRQLSWSYHNITNVLSSSQHSCFASFDFGRRQKMWVQHSPGMGYIIGTLHKLKTVISQPRWRFQDWMTVKRTDGFEIKNGAHQFNSYDYRNMTHVWFTISSWSAEYGLFLEIFNIYLFLHCNLQVAAHIFIGSTKRGDMDSVKQHTILQITLWTISVTSFNLNC